MPYLDQNEEIINRLEKIIEQNAKIINLLEIISEN